MAEIPIEIINLNANAGLNEGIVNGNVEGSVIAGITISADLCHGINIGLDGAITGQVLGNLDVLFIGAQAKGELQAAAGARALIRLEPNLLEKMGLSIYVGAYARAMASGSLAVYLTPSFFAQQIQDHLDDFPADIFLIFLEEVKAEVGVWGRVAFSAMAEVNVNVVCDIKKLNSGFEISGGYKFGLKAGSGYDFYCNVGFKNLRRAVNRSTIRISAEVKKHLLKSDLANKQLLAECFDFSFPFIVLTAYDLGNKSAERGEFLSKEEVADVLFKNFIASLQRFAVEKIIEAAVRKLSDEFSKIYYKIFGIQLDNAEKAELEVSVNKLIDLLQKGDLRLPDLEGFITETINIIDLLDQGALDDFKRPLTLFWVSSVVGFELKQLLSVYSANLGVGSTVTGEAATSIQHSRLPEAPAFVKAEIEGVLGESVLLVDVRIAVDYLSEIGIPYASQYVFPEIGAFKDYFESRFNLTFGKIFEDSLRGLQGQGTLATYHSYQAIKDIVKTELIENLIMGELLPQITSDIDNVHLYQYSQEVIRPSLYLSSDFIFKKLDNFLIQDLSGINNLPQFVNGISSGCGVVVYNVLARNIAFFDQIINDFVLDNTFAGFDSMGARLNNPQDPFFVSCKGLLSQSFSHISNIDQHIEAVRQLLLDLTYAFKEISGPTVFTADRRNNLRVLKRDILLSMAGKIDYSETPDAFVARLLDCGFIPNQELVKALGNELLKISVESFGIFIQKIIPALGDFYLAISLHTLTQMRANLIAFIDSLYNAALTALNHYNNLSDYIDENILAILDAIDLVVTNFGTTLKAHLDTWGDSAKANIHYTHLASISATVPAGAPRDLAILTFENVTWPVEAAILDVAISAGTTALKTAIDGVVLTIDTSTDIAAEILLIKQTVEDAITTGLVGFVLTPIHATASRLVNALLPDSLMNTIKEYLEARAGQKELEREQLDQEQELAFLEAEKNKTQGRYDRNNFNPLVGLEILDPVEGFPFIYPKEVILQMRLVNGNHDMISDPSSKRIQVTINSVPVQLNVGDWSQSGNDMVLNKTIDNTDDGLNIIEVSWIKGVSNQQVIRHKIPFIVNAEADYKRANFSVYIDSDPPGPDVDAEHVEIIYKGSKEMEVKGWLMQDKAGHKYHLPMFTLRPGDHLKIFTGGSQGQNKVNKSRKNKLLFMGRKKAVWNNEGDTMYLSDADRVLIYKYSYLPE
ncbi:hypothetical protein P872_13330 [Rhodonellum psychrophilum GCM71 = DSM 17998]|uniref:LTD domain-containing protein n=2 Tax=Rhodonellum TaxID=336827 RepID=U5BRY2_9BACT|nr:MULTISPECIES: lamin tail domain-containing protein [Rhodonellum]ERM80284.1 hypothetical protein P872_13330 [Rhodonellum psychrophilum GCM71 = DSM 17998]SDZ57014.1 Lamin Tail Domain [Rhodonellum ikkaensis]